MLNEGQFAGTGGWVLKPNGYRGTSSQAKIISKESQVDTMTYKVLNLTIEILAAQDLPLRKEDSKGARHPYVKCELHIEKPEERSGAPIEGGGRTRDGEHKRRTNAKNSKGNDPDFCGERIHFTSMPVVEELTFVRWVLRSLCTYPLYLNQVNCFFHVKNAYFPSEMIVISKLQLRCVICGL